MTKTWEDITTELHEEALARGQRYRDIETQSPEAALNDLKLQSNSPIWDNPFTSRFMALTDEEIEENVIWHQEILESFKER